MNNVFATAFNIKKTLSLANTNSIEISSKIIEDVILMRNLYLPSSDLTALKTLYLFLENPSEFIRKYFEGWSDTVKYLIEKPPAYHRNKNCEWFLNDFFNIEIPKKIKQKNLTKEARQFADSKRDLITPNSLDEFKHMFIQHFNSEHNVRLTHGDLKDIKRPNSGQQIVNSNLEDVELKIREILDLVNQNFTKEQLTFYEKNFKEKKYKYNSEYRNIDNYLEYKIYYDLSFLRNSVYTPLKRNIQDYIFLKLNDDNKYSKNVLNLLNFKPCKSCY